MTSNRNEDAATDSDVSMLSHEDLRDYNPDQILPQSAEDIQKIRHWLQPTPYDVVGGEYRKHLISHAPGTGDWLTASNAYTDWLSGQDHGLLWIRGIPGSGKSVMAAKLADELTQSNPGFPVLYFFFRQIIDANHEPQALLRDWMDQILDYSPPLQKQLLSYVRGSRSVKSIAMDDMWADLRAAFTNLPGKVFCIADALDEMDKGNDAFLETLGSLGQLMPEKLKVLITSRPVAHVEGPLRKIPSLHIRLQENMVDVDISTYVDLMLSKSNISQSDWKAIQKAVPGRANGLFLYARLAMDAFLEPGADISAVIEQLPVDLNALYTDLLNEHAQRSRVEPRVQHLILQAVTHATRPLRLLELADLIKVSRPDEKERGTKEAKDLIRAACGPLLEILADETISVIHHSFTEYLKGTTRSDDPSGYPVLSMGPTHAELALACLHYLQSGCLDTVVISEPKNRNGDEKSARIQLKLKYPFLEYAYSNWHHHTRQSDTAGHSQVEINIQIDNFLSMGPKLRNWLPVQAQFIPQVSLENLKLYIPAMTGLISYFRHVLANDGPASEYSRTMALLEAAQAGHANVVSELIASGTPPDAEDAAGLKPLHYAARNNHHETITVLLEAGVDPLTPKTKNESWTSGCTPPPWTAGQTPLMYACEAGHLEAVEAFLPFIRDVEVVHRALCWASGSKRANIVAKLLKYPGVDVNAKVRGSTPLYRACGSPDVPTIKALVLAGADPTIRCKPEQGPSYGVVVASALDEISKTKDLGLDCIQHLCSHVSQTVHRPNEEALSAVFSLLRQAGADIDQRDKDGKTPLHYAVRSPALTKVLLEAGADANIKDHNGETPLYHGDITVESIALLIDIGKADVNTTRNDGRPVLLAYLSSFRSRTEPKISKLLQYNPDCDTVDKGGNNALHIHIQNSPDNLSMIDELIKRGADINLRNGKGRTPIMCVRDPPKEEFLDRLVKAGVDINAVDNNGSTLLFYHVASQQKHLETLIGQGASVSVRDFRGRSLLHQLVRCHNNWGGCADSITYFVSLGLDINAIDNNGNNLLHELALREESHGHYRNEDAVKFWERLVSMGLDVDRKNHAGRTPLHILCAGHPQARHVQHNDHTPIDVVISRMRDIDVADYDGVTPLHMAVTGREQHSKKLLDAGANPAAATNEGLTPLHLAARCRMANIVGRLIEALRQRTSPENRAEDPVQLKDAAGIDAKTYERGENFTPLFYAVRSGTPETVELLLDAGASVDLEQMFKATLEFEDECSLWQRSAQAATCEHVPVKLKDRGRPKTRSSGNGFFYQLEEGQTTRLNEIWDMALTRLVEVPARTGDAFIHTLMKASIAGKDYTVSALLEVQNKWEGKISKREEYPIMKMVEGNHRSRIHGQLESLKASGLVRPGKSDENQVSHFLARREYHLVEELVSLGSSFLPMPDSHTENCLSILVRNGYASILERVGESVAASVLKTGLWHAYGDNTRPGLWFAAKDISESRVRGSNPEPLILAAVKRVLPNMTVLRLLVKKFGVHIDELHYSLEYVEGNSEREMAPADSALHSLAQQVSWWHTRQALPYLIKAGADLNIRNYKGQTPLHLAFKERNREAASILIEAGADVNAADNAKNNCLTYAQKDEELSQLLRKHGATTSAGEIFSAIETVNVEALKDILSRKDEGINANTRRNQLSGQLTHRRWRKDRRHRYRDVDSDGDDDPVEDDQVYPLFHAAVLEGDKKGAGQLVQVLLNFGADPFAKFLAKVSSKKALNSEIETRTREVPSLKVPAGYRECTVLHEVLMRHRGKYKNFVRLGTLDANHRDAKGRTLLHVACLRRPGPDDVVKNEEPLASGGDKEPSLFQRLISYGADMTARDNYGRNILHCMLHNQKYGRMENAFSYAVATCPELIRHADDDGRTPLLCAMVHAARNRETKPAEILLSAGADARAVDKNGDGCLHKLARNLVTEGLRRLFQDLVERGADINGTNAAGETPLYAFSRRPKTMSLERQFELKFDGNRFSEKDALPMLQRLAADFTVANAKGQGLLHAAANGSVERFKEVMEAGADAMMEDESQQTALDVAAACGNQPILALFEKKL